MLAEADRIRIEHAVNATGGHEDAARTAPRLVLTTVFLTSVTELKRN